MTDEQKQTSQVPEEPAASGETKPETSISAMKAATEPVEAEVPKEEVIPPAEEAKAAKPRIDVSLLKPEEVRSGMEIAIHQKIKEGDKERIQIYEGVVLSVRGGRGINGTMTVRKISNGIGVERIFPIHLPSIVKIVKKAQLRTRRSRLYYLRTHTKRMKEVSA